MRSNERLQRVWAIRQLGGSKTVTAAYPAPETTMAMLADLRLFGLTFVFGFLFTSIFIA